MSDDRTPRREFLVLSRGQWDASASKDDIQRAIEAFYRWHDVLIAEGKMRAGCRLQAQGKRVSRAAIVDGPYAETKEIVGGYWFVCAASLDEAAALMAQNPCLAFGLECEVRELDPTPGNAFRTSSETPRSAG